MPSRSRIIAGVLTIATAASVAVTIAAQQPRISNGARSTRRTPRESWRRRSARWSRHKGTSAGSATRSRSSTANA